MWFKNERVNLNCPGKHMPRMMKFRNKKQTNKNYVECKNANGTRKSSSFPLLNIYHLGYFREVVVLHGRCKIKKKLIIFPPGAAITAR
jgi:hypothetical protein